MQIHELNWSLKANSNSSINEAAGDTNPGFFGRVKNSVQRTLNTLGKERQQDAVTKLAKQYDVDPRVFMTKKELDRQKVAGTDTTPEAGAETSDDSGAMANMAGQLSKAGATSNSNTMANAPVSKTNTAKPGNLNATPTAPEATTAAAVPPGATPEQIRIAKQKQAAATAQKQMATTPVAPSTPVNYNIPAYQRKASTTTAPAASAQPTAIPASTTVSQAKPKVTTTQINQALNAIRTRDLVSIKKNIDALLVARQKKPVATAGTNAMSAMAGQLVKPSATSSTGGTTTTTNTGLVHKAATKQPTAAKGKSSKVATAKEGAPTAAEKAAFEKKLQQAIANQSSAQPQGT